WVKGSDWWRKLSYVPHPRGVGIPMKSLLENQLRTILRPRRLPPCSKGRKTSSAWETFMERKQSRRRFLKTSAAAAVGTGVYFTHGFELPSQAAQPPANRLNVAFIGAGGQGMPNINAIA